MTHSPTTIALRLRAGTEGNAALLRAGQAQGDLLEAPLPAIARVVDHKASALDADLDEFVSVENGYVDRSTVTAKCAKAIHPSENSGNILLDASIGQCEIENEFCAGGVAGVAGCDSISGCGSTVTAETVKNGRLSRRKTLT